LVDLHDRLWEESGIGPERTVLGGFSMGAVMSFTMGLDAERPPPAGILAFSGFVPTVEGWEPSFADRTGTRVFLGHGRNDPVIGIEFAHRARELVAAGGLDLTYRESELGHQIDPAHLREVATWLGEMLA
jgi:phospholipase/carboxylesterase